MTERIPEEYLTKREFADKLRLSIRTIDRYLKAGIIDADRTPGGYVRIPASEARRIMQEKAA